MTYHPGPAAFPDVVIEYLAAFRKEHSAWVRTPLQFSGSKEFMACDLQRATMGEEPIGESTTYRREFFPDEKSCIEFIMLTSVTAALIAIGIEDART